MKLITLNPQDISEYVDQLEKEVYQIKDAVLHLTWVMRGGVQYTDVLNMSSDERNMIASLSKENMEITKNSRLPYF
jgi:Mg2+ and Co2+ transporter CorA